MQRTYLRMPDPMSSARSLSGGISFRLVLTYAFDWLVLVALAAVAAILGRIAPNKRPFSLYNPDISFPFTENETVPLWLLMVLCAGVPIVMVAIVSLIFVPGPTVPRNTPKSLVWKRKLWELHVGWLGLALALVSAWFFTQGMKNMFGKPRPDLLSRCEPDFENRADYVVGGFATEPAQAILYSAAICKQADHDKLDDGFRSYPSGHSSGSAAGLIYLSLFLASKFSVLIPFVVKSGASSSDKSDLSAFPSRVNTGMSGDGGLRAGYYDSSPTRYPGGAKASRKNGSNNSEMQSMRRQAAAPPIYLLAITLAPFCLSIFIASSRWFDFRHHGFDILFGYLMGLVSAVYSFRYYHLPIQEGAGWAWGPRSKDRAFWSGVGLLGYAGDTARPTPNMDHSTAEAHDSDPYHASDSLTQRTSMNERGNFRDVEMQNIGRARP